MTERNVSLAQIIGYCLAGYWLWQPAQASEAGWDCQANTQGGWDCSTGPAAQPSPLPANPATPVTIQPAIQPAAQPAQAQSAPAPALRPLPTAPSTVPAATAPPADPDDPWLLCRPRVLPTLPPVTLEATELEADSASIEQNIYTLTGQAEVARPGQRLRADRIRYDRSEELVQAEGDVQIEQGNLSLSGSAASLRLDTDQGEVRDAQYQLHSQHARGQASLARQDSKTHRTLHDATYTTCDPEREAWRLQAREVALDEAEGTGTARHVWVELGDLPILYTPYISFPIDERRKSGLLVPSWGPSDSNGIEFSLPYYWNIAPHRDATFTPRILTKRGVQLQGEFRYLNPTNYGELGVEYLPADSEYDDRDRRLFTVSHVGQPLARLRTEVQAADVSDDQYFENLGTSLEVSSITHLERRAESTYFGDGWSFTGRVQDYQTVDSTLPPGSRPYKRLPELQFQARPQTEPYGLQFSLDSEWVYFEQDGRETGHRLDLQPTVALPWGGAAWFVTPSLGARYTRYTLEGRAAGLPEEPDRTLPVASLDSGLFFERDLQLFGTDLLQTLEPRAFYLYVPEKNQAELPVFDTGLSDFNFQQMFETNRFSSADRMGDANQLTIALTSRLLDPATGTQHASFSLGEIFYFRDREVTLPGNPVQSQSTSNLVAELDLRFSQSWKIVTGLQWDPFESKTERGSVRLQYRPDRRHLWNFAYRYRSDQLEQIDTSALWHFTPRWHGIMRWNYSLPEREILESLVGIEYESCCWILRLLGRSYVNDTDSERNDGLLVQLELKGLTSLGNPIEDLLEDGILGYSRK